MKKKILTMALLMAVMVTAAGCGKKNADSPAVQTEAETTGQETTAAASGLADPNKGFSESPMTKDMVSAGTLKAVEERIPGEGQVFTEQVPSVGSYGGSIKIPLTKAGWSTGKLIEEGLFRFKEDGSVEPNVAMGYDVNEDATVYTIYLRKGMKWSDGVDFTAEDCVFFYNHLCLPETFGKSLWGCFRAVNPQTGEDTKAKVEKVDDQTFTVTFDYPKANFIEQLCIDAKWFFTPAHYQMTIMPEFIGEEAAAKKAAEMGFSDTTAMLKATGYGFWNVPGEPTLNPYILSTETGKNNVEGDYYEFLRNPYYWKVDQENNQLPYIDKIEYTKIADNDQALIKVLSGDVTLTTDIAWKDIETIKENEDKAGYVIDQWHNALWASGDTQLQLNQTVNDADLKTLFQSKEFRQALSVCVDRKEVASLLTNGISEPQQAAPPEGTLGASKEWTEKWTDYNVDEAKKLLEGLGLVMGSDGYYDFAGGKDLVLNITTSTDSGADASYQILKKYFDAAGIKTTFKPIALDLFNNNIASNDYEVVLGPVAPAECVNIMLRPDTIVPMRTYYAAWYGKTGAWQVSGGKEGEEPTGDLKKLCELYTKLNSEVNTDKRKEIALEMMKLHQDNLWILGYMSSPTTLIVADKKLKNFPEESIFCDEYRGLGLAHIYQCYFEK